MLIVCCFIMIINTVNSITSETYTNIWLKKNISDINYMVTIN